MQRTLLLAVCGAAILFCCADPADAGPFRRRQVTRTTTPQCTGPNCQRPGTGGYLTVNPNGGFEGSLPDSYFEAPAFHPGAVLEQPAVNRERSILVTKPASVTAADAAASPAVDAAATAFAKALGEKLGIEVHIEQEPERPALSELVDKLPTFRAQIVAPDGEVIEESQIDFAEYTREQIGSARK